MAADTTRWSRLARPVALGVLALLAFVSGFLVLHGERATDSDPPLDYSAFQGGEVGVVLIVAATCAACRDDALPGVWRSAKAYASELANAADARLRVIGVSTDAVPVTGWEFLREFGDFHEVVTGGRWLNSGATRYLFQDLPGPGVVPQILIYQRTVQRSIDERPSIKGERVIQRRVGLEGILAGLSRGS